MTTPRSAAGGTVPGGTPRRAVPLGATGSPTGPAEPVPVRTASPRTAREINDRIALELLTAHGPLTAARLRELTGLSRPSVADLVARLQRSGLVAVVGEAGQARRGPNARLYGLVADRAHVAALDVRTHSVEFVVADLTGRTVAEAALPVGAEGATDGPQVVEAAVRRLHRLLAQAAVPALHTVVVGAPGLVDPASGTLRVSGTLPSWHPELLAALHTRLAGTVLVENEVNLAGIAEHRRGAVRDRDTFVLLWLGHGVGAAVVLEGRLRRGASGGAGEIGFLPVPGTGGLPTATDCHLGFHALVESGTLVELARRHGLRAARTDGSPATGPTLDHAVAVVREAVTEAPAGAGRTAEARAGAAEAPPRPPEASRRAFLAELADRIAVAGAAVASVLDPGCLVLGGELGRAGGPVLAEEVERRLGQISPLTTEVRAATVPGSPVLRGALLTALEATRRELFGSTPG